MGGARARLAMNRLTDNSIRMRDRHEGVARQYYDRLTAQLTRVLRIRERLYTSKSRTAGNCQRNSCENMRTGGRTSGKNMRPRAILCVQIRSD